MLRVINTSRTFNQVRVAGPKPRVIDLEAMGKPESSAEVLPEEVEFLEGTNFRVFASPDKEPPAPVEPAAAPAAPVSPKVPAAKAKATDKDEVK